MIINLYTHFINAYSISRIAIAPNNDGYLVYFAGVVDSTSSVEPNFITITPEQINSVEGGMHEFNLVFLKDKINKLVQLEKTKIRGMDDATKRI
jgi:hypothetical protein